MASSEEFNQRVIEHLEELIRMDYDLNYKLLKDQILIGVDLDNYPIICIDYYPIINSYQVKIYHSRFPSFKIFESFEEIFEYIDSSLEEVGISIKSNPILK